MSAEKLPAALEAALPDGGEPAEVAAAVVAWIVGRLDDTRTRAAVAEVLDETGWTRIEESGEWVRCPAPGSRTAAAIAIVKTALGAPAPRVSARTSARVIAPGGEWL